MNVKTFLGWGLLGALLRLGAATDAAAQEGDLSSCVESASGRSASVEPARDATHDDAGAAGAANSPDSAKATGDDERSNDDRPQTPAELQRRLGLTPDQAVRLASALALGEAPADTELIVEPNGQEVWREMHPYAVLGGLAN